MGGSQIYLEAGEEMTVNDLLKAICVGSANDAVVTLAERISGTEEAFVFKMNEKVKFLGYQLNPYKYAAKCDLFVCASYAEGFSTAATEALIVGTPVCTVEVSGMKEMLGENNEYGLVVENNEEALYQGIKKLLDNPELLKHYKKKAKERGKMFSTEKTVNAVQNMLLSL